ncbi:MAG TPA: hypothetical protein VIO64_20505 [Pseudobacteroides sp.]|uniref:hypothetical protein n=1 Tax=Pseudobacteroides sp. TaxID=1968840 RepID=UPI002F93C0D1
MEKVIKLANQLRPDTNIKITIDTVDNDTFIQIDSIGIFDDVEVETLVKHHFNLNNYDTAINMVIQTLQCNI